MDYLQSVVWVGVGATLVMDAWSVARQRWLGIASPDYGMVGRWIGHMPRGRFHHDSMAAVPAVRGERVIGWVAHYAIGMAFAALLLACQGPAWIRQPTLGPALAVGIATLAAPFLLMQPGMGAGIAGSRTRRPAATRIQSLITHSVFGFGLYVAAWLASQAVRP